MKVRAGDFEHIRVNTRLHNPGIPRERVQATSENDMSIMDLIASWRHSVSPRCRTRALNPILHRDDASCVFGNVRMSHEHRPPNRATCLQ